MAVAQGTCPNCGAAIEFSAGATVSKVCPYCRHIVLRTDRDLRNLGKVADLANTPSRLAVGDRGTARGAGFEVLGRVQMDFGRGPWDEFFVVYVDGQHGWITEAQGNVYVTALDRESVPIPPPQTLQPDLSVTLGSLGVYKVTERRDARMVSSEGELPHAPAATRIYADLVGPNNAFATIDYGDGTQPPQLFVGLQITPGELVMVPHGGERPGAAVKLAGITCPNCGAALPPPSTTAIERVACRYCNALSDLASMQVITRQAQAFAAPSIPLGSTGTLQGVRYTVIGMMSRWASADGERLSWEEYLLFSEGIGFRWLVYDEGTWLFTRAVSAAEVTVYGTQAQWHKRSFTLRNHNPAHVDRVLGEFYWRVEVGETVEAYDYVHGSDVLSREIADGEVNWSYSTPLDWSAIAQAFGITRPPPPAPVGYDDFDASSGRGMVSTSPRGSGGLFIGIVVVFFIIVCIFSALSSDGDGCSGGSGGGYSGGSHSYGGFGGK